MTIAQPHYNRLFTWTGINGWQVAPEPDPFREPPMPEAQRQARECEADAEWLGFGDVSELTSSVYGDGVVIDPRTAAQIDLDVWEAETRATRDSDRPY